MKIKSLFVFSIALFVTVSCQDELTLPDYKSAFIDAQEEFDESQEETFEEITSGKKLLRDSAKEVEEALSSGQDELPDIEVLRARWEKYTR